MTLKTLSKKTFDDLAQAKGKKLAFLIAATSLPQTSKDELASLVEKMNLDQIEELISALEANYANRASSGIDNDFKEKLENLVKRFEEQDKKSEENLKKTVEDIEKIF
jgi:ATP phosphoribosyltransferase regulatory subunit HisZ